MNENKPQRGAKNCSDKGSDAGERTEEGEGAKITTAKISTAVVRESEENTALFSFFARG